MKVVSQLDAQGFFVGPVIADESPLEPGVYLIPGGAVDRDPPKVLEPGKRYRVWGAGWRGEAIPEREKPAEPDAVQLMKLELLGRLAAIDSDSARPLREVAAALATGEPVPEFAAAKLAALEAEAAQIRAELAAL